MGYLSYLIDLIPASKRKYAVYAPSAVALLAISGLLGYDAAVESFTLSPEALAIIAGVNFVASSAFGMAAKKTDVNGD